jgi:hypothetical protein
MVASGEVARLACWWREADPSLPAFLPVYPAREQARREWLFDCYLDRVQAVLRAKPERAEVEEQVAAAFREWACPALNLEERHADLLLAGGFAETGREMARRARIFDPAMRPSDVFQASRNAWTANGLQVLFGLPAQLTPAIFAYSMLYPCTDNYLDRPSVSARAKLAFNKRFGLRLEGENVAPMGLHERQVWALVSMIEAQYPRAAHPEVFASLLAIHRAQERSLLLHRPAAPEVLAIVFEKGGASVLADAWLAAGSLAPPQAEFAFAWGVALQLGDDLQDVELDARDGILTLFSQAAGRAPLDTVTSRAFQFGARALAGLAEIGATGSEAVQDLIRMSFNLLLTGAAGEARRLHSERYIRELEARSPFRLSFLSERRRRLAKSAPAWYGFFLHGEAAPLTPCPLETAPLRMADPV